MASGSAACLNATVRTVAIRDYNAATGYLESVLTGTMLGTEAQSLSFAWDKVGNLISRTDENQNGLVETFDYDSLNRMTQATITQGPNYIEPLYVDYDEIGNIVYKSDVGEYNYNTRPHAVSEIVDGPRNATYSYDANGNMTRGADRAIQWTAFNKPRAIVRDSNPPSGSFYNGGTLYASNASAFFYGPDRSRYKQLRNQQTDDGFEQSTIVYVGGIYEHHDKANAPDEDRAYIQAGGQTIAIRIERDNNDNDTEYLHRDHLGSVTAMTDTSGEVQNRFSYDAFGKRRFDDWFANPSDSLLYDLAIEPRRGFTGHEHLDNVGLVHMNGRVYDPIIGRFTSPDTYVQFPETTQGFNRYTYVNNNPLSYTDPSGHFLGISAAAIGSYIASHSAQLAVSAALITAGEAFDEPLLTQVGFAILGTATGTWWQAAGVGFGAGFTASGGNLKAGLYSAATATAFYGAGSALGNAPVEDASFGDQATFYVRKAVVHGVIGGASSDIQGGSFSDGFIGAAAAQAAAPGLNSGFGSRIGGPGRVVFAATIGGTASELSGGKFANGAITAAFARGFNEDAMGHIPGADTCGNQCTLRYGPNGERFYVPAGRAAAESVSAQAKGITVGQEQQTPPLSALSPAVDAAAFFFPEVKIIQYATVAIDAVRVVQQRSLAPVAGRVVGGGVKIPLRRGTNLSESSIERIGQGVDYSIDEAMD